MWMIYTYNTNVDFDTWNLLGKAHDRSLDQEIAPLHMTMDRKCFWRGIDRKCMLDKEKIQNSKEAKMIVKNQK